MLLANRLASIQPSPTLAMTAKAGQLKAQGRDILNLSAGEPDFDTPDFIKKAALEAMNKGMTKYTAVEGILSLRQAIQAKLEKENHLSYGVDEIIVSTGGKQVLFNALMATLNEGDEVIIPAPYWVSYPDMVHLFGGVPVFITGPETQDFKISPEALEAAITPRTKWLILNSPSNPTGAVYSQEELQRLGDVLKRFPHVHIMSDDIYEYLVYDGVPFASLADCVPELKERMLLVNGVSKSYAMTGWRIGYGAGPKPLIKAMSMLQSQSTSNASSISQMAALGGIAGDAHFRDEWLKRFSARRDLCVQALNAIPGLSCRCPHGAFYVYVNCSGIIGLTTPDGQRLGTDTDFCTYLLESVGVATVSGEAFGLSPYFRISYATSEEILQTACERIKQSVLSLT